MPDQILILDTDWKPPIDDWGKVQDTVYVFTLEQAKVRFDESMSVSEDITEKSMKLLIGFATFVGFSFGLAFRIKSLDGLLHLQFSFIW